MAILPPRGFRSLYNQNHNNDDDYQKKEGCYDDSPPHGFQKSSCGKKYIHIISLVAILPYQIKKKRQNHWIRPESLSVWCCTSRETFFIFDFQVVFLMVQKTIVQYYYTTLHGINDYLRMNDHLHRFHRRIHSQMILLYLRKSHVDRNHLGESRTR